MLIKSHAKLNLSLTINTKLKSGFHNIQSIYCLIDLHDKIIAKKIKNEKSDQISFIGPYADSINQSSNSINKILNLMREYKLIKGYYNIKVYKTIPVFAGFGGGTSNAATLLKNLAEKKISKKIFNKIADIIGTDFRLFFETQGYQKNLRSIMNLSKKYRLFFLLVFPNFKSSTKIVYSKVKKYSKSKPFLKKNLSSKKNFINYLVNSKNDLQLIVEKNHPIIRKLLVYISGLKGCYLSRMTGSGSACYGLFVNKNSSKVALKKLQKKYPKFWHLSAKTI